MRPTIRATAVLLLAWTMTANAAEPPRVLSYQGYLADPAGTAVDGKVRMTLTIYDDLGVARWSESADGYDALKHGEMDLPYCQTFPDESRLRQPGTA